MKISNNIATPNLNNNTGSAGTPNTGTNKPTTKPSFGAKNPANSFNQFFKLEQAGPMTRKLFILNAFTFLLGSRIITSRDKDERRETIIRDVPTIAIAVCGVPAIEKIAAKLMEKKTGFAITEKFAKNGKTAAENINYPTINGWYKYDDSLTGGVEAFAQRLSDMGGNVKKITSSLSDNIKNQVKSMADNNAEFIKQLKENATLSEEVKNAFKNVSNNAAKKAEMLKTTSKLAGFVSTLAIIGIIIPKLNMVITNAIHKNDSKISS